MAVCLHDGPITWIIRTLIVIDILRQKACHSAWIKETWSQNSINDPQIGRNKRVLALRESPAFVLYMYHAFYSFNTLYKAV